MNNKKHTKENKPKPTLDQYECLKCKQKRPYGGVKPMLCASCETCICGYQDYNSEGNCIQCEHWVRT